jgi:cytochrome c biogenesis protein CcdA/thiol-disulfide isomerase/thioredoxin
MSIFVEILLAFVEGLAVVVSPCILPVLPLILAGSLQGERTRPYGIVMGFASIFALITLLVRQITNHLGIDPWSLRQTSFIILALLGLLMIFDARNRIFNLLTNRISEKSNDWLTNPVFNKTGFISSFLYGSLIALVWTPCVGPILAAILIQVQVTETTTNAIITMLAFVIGVALPMLGIILFGRALIQKHPFLLKHSYVIRRILGGLILIVALSGYFRFDFSLPDIVPKTKPSNSSATMNNIALRKGIASPYIAPDFNGINTWLNSKPLSIKDLKGKVVLVDFWTYSCINCIRTLPYIKDWYAKYKEHGFVVIGVHSPEFFFEHNIENISRAIADYKITYPVAVDNSFATWNNYNNKFWPAHYLINKDGEVVYTHFGEGEYDVTEHNIRSLLSMKDEGGPVQENNIKATSPGQTPETYLGHRRSERFVSEKNIEAQTNKYEFPNLPTHNWSLAGNWKRDSEYIISEGDAALRLHFNAGKVFLVMGSASPIHVTIMLNGMPIDQGNAGKDVKDGLVLVKEHRLYDLVNLHKMEDASLEIRVSKPGLECYAFTFGS